MRTAPSFSRPTCWPMLETAPSSWITMPLRPLVYRDEALMTDGGSL
jgi:hypothetical protein